MKLKLKTMLTLVFVAIFASTIFNVQASPGRHYLSAQIPGTGSPGIPTQIDLTQNPIGTEWHELYPTYSNVWKLINYIDNGDNKLSASDQVEFEFDPQWYHVHEVLTTIHWTWKEGWPGDPTPTVESASETDYLGDELPGVNPDPSVLWHQIYPPSDFSRYFRITSHEDANENGLIDPSEQFDITYEDDGEVRWAHLDAISTDITVRGKDQVPEFPFGLELGLGLGLAVAIIYVAWKRRPISLKKI